MSGSGGGGGYQYQAQATAFIATHILAKQPLHWIEHFVADVPTIVAEETNGPGDDIRITLQDGSVVEVQAKHGLKKNEKFWEAIVKLIRGLVEDSSLYGVLLTDSTASSTIRDELRKDIIRLGQGREDGLKAITQEVIGRLRQEGISHSSDIFKRLRIVIADLDNSQRDAKTALGLLPLILKNPEQAGQAWKMLSDDGLDLIKTRGQRDAEALLRLLGSNGLQLSPVTNLEREVDWQETCRGMLDRQIQFPTLNDLMAKDGVRIDPTLFVPVGLVERKQKQHQRSDLGSSEQGSQLLQPTKEEIVKRFDDEEEFFSQVICNSDLSNHSRLVITGEPGAGKTTLLQKIGDRLCQAGMFPIWFSLGKSGVLPTYEFLSRVLKENAQPRNFESSSWDASINALLQTGKVWLLLDGADEFTTNGNPLHIIGSQLREAWANQVRIVLTCRLNVWDTYALPEFKVFRTLEFDYRTPVDGYSNQVEAYIHRFFTKDGVDPQLSNTLLQQLHLPGKESIRDSVKNPLRLSLLCYVWESRIGELPDTRAELYQIFIDYYYDLQERKHPEISIDRTERDTLNLALGELAKAALDSHNSRFRLRKSLIETIPTMGKESAKDSLFDKAVRLGWLNRIGTTAEKPYEAAYAFFHTTFQEYFAALAIDDWHYFLRQAVIFEPQWRQVIFLWLGRGDIDKSEKHSFLDILEDFQECGGFYRYEAERFSKEIISMNEFGIYRKPRDHSITVQAGSSLEINLADVFIRGVAPDENHLEHTKFLLDQLEESQGDLSWTEFNSERLAEINQLLESLSESKNDLFNLNILKRLLEINSKSDTDLVEINFMKLFEPAKEDIYRIITWILTKLVWKSRRIGYSNLMSVSKLLVEALRIENQKKKTIQHWLTRKWAAKFLIRVLVENDFPEKILILVVKRLNYYTVEGFYESDYTLYKWCREVILRCNRLPYPDFYQAWHSSSSSTDAESSIDS